MILILQSWDNEFFKELKKTEALKIISPFIQEDVIERIKNNFDFNKLQIITRFNVRDFVSGVSSAAGLRLAIENGARVYGVKKMHSKVYLFDKRAAIVTSANLTWGGLRNNFECGVYITEKSAIRELHKYFKDLKSKRLTKTELNKMEGEVKRSQDKVKVSNDFSFPDFGADVDNKPIRAQGKIFDTNKTYNEDSVWDMLIKGRVASYGNHTYFAGRLKKGDIVFLSHKGYGIIAAGKVTSTNAIEEYNEDIDEEEGYVNVEWLTKVPVKEEGINKYVTYPEVKKLLNRTFYAATTLKTPYLTYLESQILLKKLKKVTG